MLDFISTNSPGNQVLQPNDPLKYVELLTRSIVGYKDCSIRSNCPKVNPEAVRQDEAHLELDQLIAVAIQRMLNKDARKKGIKDNHVLAQGYQKSNERTTGGLCGAWQIENFFPNGNVFHIKSDASWHLLLHRIGDGAFMHMLLNTSIFLPIGNGPSFLQICGPSLLNANVSNIRLTPPQFKSDPGIHSNVSRPTHINTSVKRSNCMALEAHRPAKKAKRSKNLKKKLRPSKVILPWSSVFYSKPSFTHRGFMRAGFPNDHALSLLESPDEVCHALLQAMFPHQFGLCSALYPRKRGRLINGPESSSVVAKKVLRSSEIPWRMKSLIPLVTRMIRLCKNCNISALLENYCPLPSSQRNCHTQIMTYEISHKNVFLFVRSVMLKIIPNTFWGSDVNRECILKMISTAISFRRFETLSLQNILSGIKISDMQWLNGKPNAPHPSTCESEKRREIMCEFLYWVFSNFLIPLIRGNFYATETTPQRNCVFYFRHKVWHRISLPMYLSIKKNQFERVPKKQLASIIMEKKALGFSFIRFLPKATGARIITNLGRKPDVKELYDMGLNEQKVKELCGTRARTIGRRSINQLLQNVFQVMKYEKTQCSQEHLSSALGLNDIYRCMKSYKKKLLERFGGKIPNLYCCKVDIAACFDTIDQEKLISILERVFTEPEYVVKKYGSIYPHIGSMRKAFLKKAYPGGNLTFKGLVHTFKLLTPPHPFFFFFFFFQNQS